MNATEPSKQGDFSIICRTRARCFNAAQVRVKDIKAGGGAGDEVGDVGAKGEVGV